MIMKRTTYVIFDLDNCLADDRERIPLIDWSAEDPDLRYDAYHARCGEDPVGNWDLFVHHTEACGRTPIFMTARPTTVHTQTVAWITDHLGIINPILMMRNAGDRRRSVEVKREMLSWLDHWDISKGDIIVALDDHPDIIEMYKREGIAAVQTAIHTLNAYDPPLPTGELLSGPPLDMGRDIGLARRSPDSFLRLAAETYERRTSDYGTLYKDLGPLWEMFFPEGLTLRTGEDFVRFSVLNHAVNKLGRYARSMESGGHDDSAHDLMVYAAMLREVTK